MSFQTETGKLALGTVQFGMPYGIANQTGQVLPSEVAKILGLARENRISTLDTAIAYGESEGVLGRHCLDEFSVITKLPEVPEACQNVAEWVNAQLEGSLARLNVSRLDGVLLHKPDQLLNPEGEALYQAMEALKKQGVVKRIGISVYGPEQLETLCRSYNFDLVQTPFNILDRRLKESGWLEELQKRGTGLHVRSVFMQGLLLMSKKERPEKFYRWNALWSQWSDWLNEIGQTPLEACLRHALSIPEIEKIVVGVDSYSQLQQIIQAANGTYFAPPHELQTRDNQLLNPYFWKNL